MRNRKGFTLIEVIVVAAIVAVLAGVLVPIILQQIDESKTSRVLADLKSVSTAIMVLKKDTGSWPVSTGCDPTVELLNGGGNMPVFSAQANWLQTMPNTFDNYLNTDANGCWPDTWKGPYMAVVNPDPWGNAYISNASEFLTTSGNVWIISAGPDGIVNTGRGARAVTPDDIGLRIK